MMTFNILVCLNAVKIINLVQMRMSFDFKYFGFAYLWRLPHSTQKEKHTIALSTEDTSNYAITKETKKLQSWIAQYKSSRRLAYTYTTSEHLPYGHGSPGIITSPGQRIPSCWREWHSFFHNIKKGKSACVPVILSLSTYIFFTEN